MTNEENESANIKADNPLTPQQDNRAFESIPVRPAPWTSQRETGSPMNRERALSMFRTANQWLYSKIKEDATCECGNCYLCAYNFFASTPPSTAAAIRAAAEEVLRCVLGFNELDDLAQLSPENGNRKYVVDELVAILSRLFGKGETELPTTFAVGVVYPCVVDHKTLIACLQTATQALREPDEPRRIERFHRTKEKLLEQAKANTLPIAAPAAPSPAEGILEGRARAYSEAETERLARWKNQDASAALRTSVEGESE